MAARLQTKSVAALAVGDRIYVEPYPYEPGAVSPVRPSTIRSQRALRTLTIAEVTSTRTVSQPFRHRGGREGTETVRYVTTTAGPITPGPAQVMCALVPAGIESEEATDV